MKPYFKLADYTDKDDLTQIQLYYFNKKKRVRLDTGIKTKSIYWNQETQRIISRCSEIDQDAKELNDILDEKINKLNKIRLDYKREYTFEPDCNYVKKHFHLEGTKMLNAREVKSDFEHWILNEKKRAVKYIKIFNSVLKDLNEFHPDQLYFRDLDYEFFDSLKFYWLDKQPPIQNSTIIKRFRCFKIYLNERKAKGVNEFDWFEKYSIGLKNNNQQPVIIPTPEEFNILMDFKFEKERFNDARDLYVISCTTGLRFSDVIRLTPKNIIGDDLIADITKTKKAQLLIPLNEVSKKFICRQFEKYGFMRHFSNADMNNLLCGKFNPKTKRRSGGLFEFISKHHKDKPFSESVSYNVSYGKDTEPIWVPKYEALSFHSSRRYFISYLVNVAKVDVGNVMAWSGHTDYKTIIGYVQKGQNQKETMMNAFKLKDPPPPQEQKE